MNLPFGVDTMLGDIIALEIDMKSEPLNVKIDFQYYNINIGYYNK